MTADKYPKKSSPPETKPLKPLTWRGWLFRGVGMVVGVFTLVAIVLLWLITSAPAFYTKRLTNPNFSEPDPADDLEAKVLDFRNRARKPGAWQGTFTESSLNRWFGHDLIQKHGNPVPTGTSSPRVAFEEGRFKIGITIKKFGLASVFWLDSRVEKSTAANSFAIRIDHLKLGQLSIPLSFFEQTISSALREQRISTQWLDDQNGRVLLVNLPAQLAIGDNTFSIIEAVEFADGSAQVTVTTFPRQQY